MKKSVAVFFAVVILALVLRVAGITSESLWLDEEVSMVDAYGHACPTFFEVPTKPFIFQFAPPETVDAVQRNLKSIDPLCPPIYAMVLNRWITAFGGTDFSVRMLSVLISVGCLSVVFWLSYGFLGLRAALLTGLIQAVSPFNIYYAHEVRMYSLVAFMAAISSACLLTLIFRNPGGWRRLLVLAGYAVSTWAMINSHYTSLFILIFQIIFSLKIAFVRRSWTFLLEMAAAWSVVGLLWLPWFDVFRHAASLRTAGFYVMRQPSWSWPFVALFGRIPGNWIGFLSGKTVAGPALPIYGASVLLLICAVATIAIPASVLNRWCSTKLFISPWSNNALRVARNVRLYLLGWAVVPALGLWFTDVLENHRVIEISRYMIGTMPAIYMLVGAGLASLNWRNILARALLAIYLLCAVANTVVHGNLVYEREPWRQMASTIQTVAHEDDLVLISAYYNLVCLDRYLKVPLRQVGIAPNLGQQHLDAVLTGVNRFVLLTAQEGEAIAPMIPSRFHLINKIDMAHGLHLRVYQI